MAGASLVAATIAALIALPVGLAGWAAVPVLLTAYWCGLSLPRRRAGRTLVLVAAGFGAVATLVHPRWWTGLAPMVLAALLAGGALGHAERSRRELAAARQDRARHEERLHLARDVHDLVAHHLAVVNVHAGLAAHLLPGRPAAAATALDQVGRASSAALDELGTLLGSIREPTPGLGRLDRLLGPGDELTVLGTARPLPATVDSTAYRIAQEALTNARKHGRGPARLTLRHDPHALVVECRNARVEDRRPGGPGHGLRGMRERVDLLGGELVTGPAGAEFVVRARLPVRAAG